METEPSPDSKPTRTFLRTADGGLVAGVLAGLARWGGLDATLLRAVTATTFVFATAIGLALPIAFWILPATVVALYLVGWAAMPAEPRSGE